jgi:hypothetical protein
LGSYNWTDSGAYDNDEDTLIEIRTIEHPLTFGVYVIDPQQTGGTLPLKHCPFKMPVGRARPGLVLRPVDQRWYDLFWAEIQTLWNNGKPWSYEESTGDDLRERMLGEG